MRAKCHGFEKSPYDIGLFVVGNNGRCKICCGKGRRSKCIFRATRELEHQKENFVCSKVFQGISLKLRQKINFILFVLNNLQLSKVRSEKSLKIAVSDNLGLTGGVICKP